MVIAFFAKDQKNQMFVDGAPSVLIGWSLCNTKLDKFDKSRAEVIATGRAQHGYRSKRLNRFLKAEVNIVNL